MAAHYKMPSQVTVADGRERTVGYELEFSGLTMQDAVSIVAEGVNGAVVEKTAAECKIESEELGTFKVEVDWGLFKEVAQDVHEQEPVKGAEELLEKLGDTATTIVPLEVVGPPLALSQMSAMDGLIVALRNKGAEGTNDRFTASFGMHINAEIPELTPTCLWRYICAYSLLQWWLVKAHRIDVSRKIGPYIDLYAESYLLAIFALQEPTMNDILATYIKYNTNRNYGLDMYPLLSHIDPNRIQIALGENQTQARPTFHYRLPNCDISKDNWGLQEAWNLWWVVEELANMPDEIDMLKAEYIAAHKPVIGVNRSDWVERMQRWVEDHELL